MEIAFGNPGVIDPCVWSTFGVSVKETDGAIGKFGTGLKYAIAVLLRHGRKIRIVSGGDSFVFGVKDVTVRGKTFEQVTCNGDPLPFTTHLGERWQLWQVYRELYSNMLDEGGALGGDHETVVYAEIGDVSHHDVFLDADRSPLVCGPHVDVYARNSKYLFYKGVRVMELPRLSRFTYNLRNKDFSLSEDRALSAPYEAHVAIAEALFSCAEKSFVWEFLHQTKDWWEKDIDLDWAFASQPSELALSYARELRHNRGTYFHPSAYRVCLRHLGEIGEEVEPSGRQRAVLKRAMSFLEAMGEPVTHPITVMDAMGDAVGKADRMGMRILLSSECLDKGVKFVASTLLEEQLHLAKGLSDCTYDMQTYLFDKIITMGEDLTGEVL